MSRYRVTVPVIVICTYEVEAEDCDDAIGKPVRLERLFCPTSDGIAAVRDAHISPPTRDNALWDKAEAEPADDSKDAP